jgi:hypothetical protein
MAHPHLTEYLLVLATDSTKLRQYNEADKCQREALGKAAHLTSKQSEALESADSARIMEEVLKELGVDDKARGGTHYTIQLALVLQPCKKNG